MNTGINLSYLFKRTGEKSNDLGAGEAKSRGGILGKHVVKSFLILIVFQSGDHEIR